MSESPERVEARRVMAQIVAEKGTAYVYPGAAKSRCWYQVEGKPSCIVGHYISYVYPDLFAEIAEIGSHEGTSADFVLPSRDKALLGAFALAQTKQDSGSNWGEVLHTFNTYLDNNKES